MHNVRRCSLEPSCSFSAVPERVASCVCRCVVPPFVVTDGCMIMLPSASHTGISYGWPFLVLSKAMAKRTKKVDIAGKRGTSFDPAACSGTCAIPQCSGDVRTFRGRGNVKCWLLDADRPFQKAAGRRRGVRGRLQEHSQSQSASIQGENKRNSCADLASVVRVERVLLRSSMNTMSCSPAVFGCSRIAVTKPSQCWARYITIYLLYIYTHIYIYIYTPLYT